MALFEACRSTFILKDGVKLEIMIWMSVWKELLLELVKGIVEATAAWFKSSLHSWIYCLRTLKLIRLQGTKYKEYVLYMYCFFRCVLLATCQALYKIRQAILEALQRLV